jgi:hypothetical protein
MAARTGAGSVAKFNMIAGTPDAEAQTEDTNPAGFSATIALYAPQHRVP